MRLRGVFALTAAILFAVPATADNSCPTLREAVDVKKVPILPAKPAARLSTQLAPDAVIAIESVSVFTLLKNTYSLISTKFPVEIELKSGTELASMTFEGGEHWCVSMFPAYKSVIDETGNKFTIYCLADKNKDDQYEIVQFFRDGASAGQDMLEATITPVRLVPSSNPMLNYNLYQRLRLKSLDKERATFVIDNAFFRPPPPQLPGSIMQSTQDVFPERAWFTHPKFEQTISLREGPTTILGLPVDILAFNDRWVATPAGSFAPWVSAESCDGSMVLILDPPLAD